MHFKIFMSLQTALIPPCAIFHFQLVSDIEMLTSICSTMFEVSLIVVTYTIVIINAAAQKCVFE